MLTSRKGSGHQAAWTLMREAGLIEAREQGRWVYYRLRPAALEQLQGFLAEVAAGCGAPAAACCP